MTTRTQYTTRKEILTSKVPPCKIIDYTKELTPEQKMQIWDQDSSW